MQRNKIEHEHTVDFSKKTIFSNFKIEYFRKCSRICLDECFLKNFYATREATSLTVCLVARLRPTRMGSIHFWGVWTGVGKGMG
jgi:hypothetical protein